MMKQVKVLLISLALSSAASFLSAQSPATEVISSVQTFIQAGDQRDVATLKAVLHPEFRVVMNQLFGSTELTVLAKQTYVQKIENREFGGDSRTLTIESVQVNGDHAMVRVLTVGSKMTMRSDLTLVKDARGRWLILADVPTII